MAAGSGASAPLANQWAARTLPTIWGSEPDSWFSTRQWPASEQATALRSRQKLIEVRGSGLSVQVAARLIFRSGGT